MRRAVSAAVAAVVLLAAAASAQSLGELAKKERERRRKNRERGVAVRVLTEEGTETTEGTAPAEPPTATDGEADESAAAAGEPEDPSVERARAEAEWRRRMAEARERLERARERRELLGGLHLVEGQAYVDENGNAVISSLGELRRLVREAEEELAAAEKAMADLREEARRQGVPPGWLR